MRISINIHPDGDGPIQVGHIDTDSVDSAVEWIKDNMEERHKGESLIIYIGEIEERNL